MAPKKYNVKPAYFSKYYTLFRNFWIPSIREGKKLKTYLLISLKGKMTLKSNRETESKREKEIKRDLAFIGALKKCHKSQV